jgi:hypothetical protein
VVLVPAFLNAAKYMDFKLVIYNAKALSLCSLPMASSFWNTSRQFQVQLAPFSILVKFGENQDKHNRCQYGTDIVDNR